MSTNTLHEEISSNKTKTVGLLLFFMMFVAVTSAILGYVFTGSVYVSAIAIPIAIIYATFSYYSAGKMAIKMSHARQIELNENPRLYRIVENLSITLGMPMPKVYIIDDKALNAFATGRNPENAIVAATTGLLDSLTDVELEGVMAHEIGHIKNYDIRVSMMAFALVAVISIIADIGLRMMWFGGDRNRNSNGAAILIGLLIAIIAPLIATLIRFAISRQREYLADATGALTTRYPEGLATALEKIKQQGSVTKNQNSATAHFYFSNPLKKSSISSKFSTHPPIDDRISRLRDMEDGVLGNEK